MYTNSQIREIFYFDRAATLVGTAHGVMYNYQFNQDVPHEGFFAAEYRYIPETATFVYQNVFSLSTDIYLLAPQ